MISGRPPNRTPRLKETSNLHDPLTKTLKWALFLGRVAIGGGGTPFKGP